MLLIKDLDKYLWEQVRVDHLFRKLEKEGLKILFHRQLLTEIALLVEEINSLSFMETILTSQLGCNRTVWHLKKNNSNNIMLWSTLNRITLKAPEIQMLLEQIIVIMKEARVKYSNGTLQTLLQITSKASLWPEREIQNLHWMKSTSTSKTGRALTLQLLMECSQVNKIILQGTLHWSSHWLEGQVEFLSQQKLNKFH